MSQRALLLAIRDTLRQAAPNGLGLANAECEVMFDGEPPPACGERFVAIHPGAWTGNDIEGLDELFDAELTFTIRAAKVPRDRLGINLLVGPTGKSLDELLEAARALLHLDSFADQVISKANTTIGIAANGFVEPPRFRHASRPEAKGPAWFSAEAHGHGAQPPMGIAQTITLGGARRVQRIESED